MMPSPRLRSVCQYVIYLTIEDKVFERMLVHRNFLAGLLINLKESTDE